MWIEDGCVVSVKLMMLVNGVMWRFVVDGVFDGRVM